MKKSIKIIIFIIIIIFITPSSIFAEEFSLGTLFGFGPWQAPTTDAGCSLSKLASTILGLLTTIGGLAVFLQLVVGALSWITSGGDKANLEKARSQITNAIVGLIIIIASWTIVYLIGGIFGIDIINPQNLLKKLDPNYKAPTVIPTQLPSSVCGPGSFWDPTTKQCL